MATHCQGVLAAGISFSDDDRMALCATMQDHLYVEMGMRFQDKEVAVFSFSRERGTENGEPHLNGHFDLNTTATDKPLVTRKEHAALKTILDRATSMPVRLVLKIIPPTNRTYGYLLTLTNKSDQFFERSAQKFRSFTIFMI